MAYRQQPAGWDAYREDEMEEIGLVAAKGRDEEKAASSRSRKACQGPGYGKYH